MICCHRTWRRQANRHPTAIFQGGRQDAATGAAAAARNSSVKIFCAAARPLEPLPGMTAEEPSVTIPPDLEAQILRYYHVEKWRPYTIARQLHVHHGTVARVLAQAGLPSAGQRPRPSRIDPYLPFIRQTLETFPTLTASRLYAMVRERGYRGSPDHFRHLIALHRPRPAAEAYLRLRTLPGEQAQVDWAHFEHLTIGRARRPLMAFVMVLSYSRQIFLHFFLDARMENFLRGHAGAFDAWGGVPRVLLYDNLTSFAGHYRFEPRPVAVARGNEKGRVERAIRYVRDSFFAGRDVSDVDALNVQARDWCRGIAADRRCPGQDTVSVREAFAEEAPRLLPLPDNAYPLIEQVPVKAGKTPYIRFDLNDYSIPHTQVRRWLTVLADPAEVRITDGVNQIARHPRSYGKGEQIEDGTHIQALVERKRAARRHRAADLLFHAAPASADLLARAGANGGNLRSIAAALTQLLQCYGAAELQAAIAEALDRDVPHQNAVRFALERRRQERQLPPPIALNLPAHVQAKDTPVRPVRLELYDKLKGASDE